MLKLLPLIAILFVQGCATAATKPLPPHTQNFAILNLPRQQDNTLSLIKTRRVNSLGNPIWTLTAPNGKSYDVVTGRFFTQNRNRHQSGTEAPLPPGIYSIGQTHFGPFSLSELGDHWFVDLIPQFNTGRTELGIHLDPSFDMNNDEDGTSGCIGLTNSHDLEEIVNLIQVEGINRLIVIS